MHSDQFKPKSYLKLNKKCVFFRRWTVSFNPRRASVRRRARRAAGGEHPSPSNSAPEPFSQRSISLLKTRRMNYNLTLKGHFENLTSGQGHDLIEKGHVAYHSIRIVGFNTFMVLLLLYLVSIKSYCRKTAGDLSWPEMTLFTWWHDEDSLVAIFWFRVSILPVNWCLKVFRMVFVQKRHLSISSIDI